MSKSSFLKKHGFLQKNPQWSWCSVNDVTKKVAFGTWDVEPDSNGLYRLLSKDWSRGSNGRKLPGFGDALEKIELIRDRDYGLVFFVQIHGLRDRSDPDGTAKILGFVPELHNAELIELKDGWYAREIETEVASSSAAVDDGWGRDYLEGSISFQLVGRFERSAKARAAAIRYFGAVCQACGLDFEKVYGDIGRGFIEVHHRKPLSEIRGEYRVQPERDLIPLCANCHRMAHRRTPPIPIEELRGLLLDRRS